MRGNGEKGGRLEDWMVGSLATAYSNGGSWEVGKLGSWAKTKTLPLSLLLNFPTSQLLSFRRHRRCRTSGLQSCQASAVIASLHLCR